VTEPPVPVSRVRLGSLSGSDSDAADVLEDLTRGESEQLAPQGAVVPPSGRVFTAYVESSTRVMRAIQFAWRDAARLAEQMRTECEYAYSSAGEAGLERLGVGITLTARAQQRFHDWPERLPLVYRNAIPHPTVQEAAAAADRTREAFEAAAGRLRSRAAATLVGTQRAAQLLATHALEDARSEIREEATRYLNIGAGSRASTDDILMGAVPRHRRQLQGSDVVPLALALQRLEVRRRNHQVTAVRQEEAARHPGADRVSAARAVLSSAEELTAAVAVEASRFPVLHRIWSATTLPLDGLDPVGRPGNEYTLSGRTTSAAAAVERLRESLWDVLRASWAANGRFARTVQQNPECVWRYPPLVQRALARTAPASDDRSTGPKVTLPAPSIEPWLERSAAQVRIDSEKDMSALSKLSLSGGLMAGVLGLSAAPPVAILITAVGATVLSVAESYEDYRRLAQQDDAYVAVLDPARAAIANEPGYVGLIVSIVFNVFDLAGVRDAVRVARAAASSAAHGSALLDPL
jgi:hypothetical protein